MTVPGVVAGWRELAGARRDASACAAPLLRARGRWRPTASPVAPGLARAIVDRARRGRRRRRPARRFPRRRRRRSRPARRCASRPWRATLEPARRRPRRTSTRRDRRRPGRASCSARGSAISAADFAAHAAERAEPLSADRTAPLRWWAAPPPAQGATALALLDGAAATRPARPRPRRPGRPRAPARRPPRRRVDVDGHARPGAAGAGRRRAAHGTGDTVAVTAVDGEGRSVALIQSVFQTFGAGLLEPRTGIVLHNRGSRLLARAGPPGRDRPGPPAAAHALPAARRARRVRAAIGCQGGSAQPLILSQVAAAALDPDAASTRSWRRRAGWSATASSASRSETVLAEPGAEAALGAELAAPARRRWSAARPARTAAATSRSPAPSAPVSRPPPTRAPTAPPPSAAEAHDDGGLPALVPAIPTDDPEGVRMSSFAPTQGATGSAHPLDPLTPAEINAAVAAAREDDGSARDTRFWGATLDEAHARAVAAGEAPAGGRRIRLVAMPAGGADALGGRRRGRRRRRRSQPSTRRRSTRAARASLREEARAAAQACREDPASGPRSPSAGSTTPRWCGSTRSRSPASCPSAGLTGG